jgi:hypothetical protein
MWASSTMPGVHVNHYRFVLFRSAESPIFSVLESIFPVPPFISVPVLLLPLLSTLKGVSGLLVVLLPLSLQLKRHKASPPKKSTRLIKNVLLKILFSLSPEQLFCQLLL